MCCTLARFVAPEFTSLCPVTGQPDFAHLVIDYAPGDWLIESKSLKLYLTSFRNHGLVPRGLHRQGRPQDRRGRLSRAGCASAVTGIRAAGIPIDVFWQTGPAPEGLWVPDQGVAPYRGRG